MDSALLYRRSIRTAQKRHYTTAIQHYRDYYSNEYSTVLQYTDIHLRGGAPHNQPWVPSCLRIPLVTEAWHLFFNRKVFSPVYHPAHFLQKLAHKHGPLNFLALNPKVYKNFCLSTVQGLSFLKSRHQWLLNKVWQFLLTIVLLSLAKFLWQFY